MQKNNKIKNAVSSCLLGEAVRYDGTDKHIHYITEHLAKEYNLISICPEMEIGMGIPRPPIHLVANGKNINAVDVENPETNVPDAFTGYGKSIQQLQPELCGYIFKKNSPSCGPANVKVMNPQSGEYELRGQGIYVRVIRKYFPELPIIDEEDCLDEKRREQFLIDVVEHARWVL